MTIEVIQSTEIPTVPSTMEDMKRWAEDFARDHFDDLKKLNTTLALISEGFVEISKDDSLPGDAGNWRLRHDGTDLVLQLKIVDTWTDTAFKMLTTGDIVVPKASGNGIKVDLSTPTFGFADLLGEVFTRNTGATKPTRAAFKGGLFGFQFGVGDNEEFEYHIKHDHVLSSDIFLHIHWGHNGASVTGGTITFDYELSYAKGFGQGVFGANAVGTIVSDPALASQYSHELSETKVSISGGSATQLDSDSFEPDGIIKATVGVNANDLTVSGGGVPEPFIHFVDIHYQTTGVIGTKQKRPDFYT